MKFPKGNKIRYSQDFGVHIGVPHDVQFQVEMKKDHMILTGPGYGTTNNYGNGHLRVSLPFADGFMAEAVSKSKEQMPTYMDALRDIRAKIDKEMKAIGEHRENLEVLYSDLGDIVYDTEQAEDSLGDARNAIQGAIDEISKHV